MAITDTVPAATNAAELQAVKLVHRYAEIEALRAEILAQIKSAVPVDKQADLIAVLNSNLDGAVFSPLSISAIRANVKQALGLKIDRVEAEEEHEQFEAMMLATEGSALVKISAAAAARVRIRAERLDLTNTRSVLKFAESLVDEELPPALRKKAAADVAAMLRRPELTPILELYNSCSPQARKLANEQYEQTRASLKALKQLPAATAVLKKECDIAEVLGNASDAQTQKIVSSALCGKMKCHVAANEMHDRNDERFRTIIDNIPLALRAVPGDVRARAERIGSHQQIVEKAMEGFKHKAGMSQEEQDATRVFMAAKSKIVFEMLASAASQIDLEIKQTKILKNHRYDILKAGNYEQNLEARTIAAEKVLGDKPEFEQIPADRKHALIKSSLRAADNSRIAIKDIGKINDAQFSHLSNSVYEESWDRKAITAAGLAKDVASAFSTTDKAVTDEISLKVGRGARNTLQAMGLGEKQAQIIGHEVTVAMQMGAKVKKEALEAGHAISQGTAQMKQAVSTKINDVQVSWNKDDDIQKLLGKLEEKGWKQHADMDKDGKLEVSDITRMLSKANVKLEQFDKNHDGHINGAELSAAMTAALQKERADAAKAKASTAKAQEQLKQYDTNHNGKIDANEMAGVLKLGAPAATKAGEHLTPAKTPLVAQALKPQPGKSHG